MKVRFKTSEPLRLKGSNEMYALHEALAREHMRAREAENRQRQLASELAAINRWRYLERRAQAAHQRHLRRVEQVAHLSAVAD
jgi:hypothetical protein